LLTGDASQFADRIDPCRPQLGLVVDYRHPVKVFADLPIRRVNELHLVISLLAF